MSRIIRYYLKYLERYPLRTQATTTGILMGTGDIIAQVAIEKKTLKQWEPIRTSRFLFYGFIITGPCIRGWYLLLEKYVRFSSPALTTVSRVTMDQTIFAPSFLSVFLYSMTFLRTKSHVESVRKTKEDFMPVLKNNWKLWPGVQLVNFYLVPFQHRILVVNVVALIWNTYLAWATNREAVEH